MGHTSTWRHIFIESEGIIGQPGIVRRKFDLSKSGRRCHGYVLPRLHHSHRLQKKNGKTYVCYYVHIIHVLFSCTVGTGTLIYLYVCSYSLVSPCNNSTDYCRYYKLAFRLACAITDIE